MIKYSEQMLSTPLKTGTFKSTSPTPPRITSASAHDSRFSLTPLWEFVVRTKSLPEGLDLNVFFQVIQERLQNPEREVRQHALRVLAEVITVIDNGTLDTKMEQIIPDLVTNLGHIGPAVRKGAIDCLKVYLNCSNNADDILKGIVQNGVEKSSESKTRSSIVTGIIVALPFLIKKVSRDTITYIIRVIYEKMVQLTYQEVALKALVRIKDLIGDVQFKESTSNNLRKDFEQLSDVYNVDGRNLNQGGVERSPYHLRNYWNDFNDNIVEETDLESGLIIRKTLNEIVEDKVILETEIKLNSGPAITMQIHEESRQNVREEGESEDDGRNSVGVVKVLNDDSEDYYESRRTPRRVRFGGEIVKLRTPDSDSNQASDLDDSTITVTPRDENGSKPLIEIQYNDIKTNRTISHIPVSQNKRTKPVRSEPTSPSRSETKAKKFHSTPDLRGSKVPSSASRIPRRTERSPIKSAIIKDQKSSHTTTIQIKFSDPFIQKANPKVSREVKKVDSSKKETKPRPPPLKIVKIEEKNENEAVPTHKEIEIFHNLTRSPERKDAEPEFPKPDDQERQIRTADNATPCSEEVKETSTRDVHTAGDMPNQSNMSVVTSNPYGSFQVFPAFTGSISSSTGAESPIPTNDTGDCLTCSSSGSDIFVIENWEDAGVIDPAIIKNLKSKDDWRMRLKGLEDLHRALQNTNTIKALEPKISSLVFFLFGCEQYVRLQAAAEDALKIIFANVSVEVLRGRLNQIVTALCKMGSPAGVRLSILLMRRIKAEEFLNHLFNSSTLGAKSSKIREGALQILMTISRIFPSTEVNVVKATEFVTPLLRDRKKRVRRASLETIASLAQLGSTSTVLDIVSKTATEYPDKDQLRRVVRARLARRQLPAVDLNGSISYSAPSGESELEWISNGSATPSPLCTGHNLLGESIEDFIPSPLKLESANPLKLESAKVTNYWKSNARHTENTEGILTSEKEEESDWSRESVDVKDDPKSQNIQIWAVDPWTLSTPVKLSTANGTLRPLYLIQRESNNTNSTNSDESFKAVRSPRGRSYSPPKRKVESSNSNSEDRERFIAVSNDNSYFQNLHKSVSSDLTRTNGITQSGSTSSTNSDASIRSGLWQKSFKSAIPVPVSSDSRLRFRTRHQVEVPKGPVSVPPQFYRTRKVVDVTPPKISTPIVSVGHLHSDDLTKTPSSEVTPERRTLSQRSVLVRQPFSSGSEASELCTPPAEPHLVTNFSRSVEQSPLKSPRQPESFVEVDSPRYHSENFTVIEDSAPDVLEENKTFSRAQSVHSHIDRDSLNIEEHYSANARVKREDSFETQCEFESDEAHTSHETLKTTINDDSEVFSLPKTFIETKLSKSEVNIQISPEILRKSVKSAPALNDLIRYDKRETTESTLEITVLPGALTECISTQECQEVKIPKPKPQITRQFSRKNSLRASKRDTKAFPDYLNPFPKAKDGLNESLMQLELLDWEITMKGLQGIVRLTRHHPEILDLNMHATCVALGRHIRNLRSQVARAACLAATEMFSNHKKPLELELDEIAVPLLHRTADTNKFLRSDANAALDKMCLQMSLPRVISIIATKGAVHQNAIVRCTAARLLCSLTNRLGAERTFQLPRDSRDKILHTGANMLLEGNLETRKHAKMMFANLIGHCQFNKALTEAVPVCTIRNIQKTLRSLQ